MKKEDIEKDDLEEQSGDDLQALIEGLSGRAHRAVCSKHNLPLKVTGTRQTETEKTDGAFPRAVYMGPMTVTIECKADPLLRCRFIFDIYNLDDK